MAFVLLDGVVANDAFATPASAGTSQLVEGINNQAFATPASATAQPVDAVLGLTTWTAGAPAACNVSAALVDAADTLAAVVTPVTTASNVSAALVDPADTVASTITVSSAVSAALIDPADTLAASVSVSSAVSAVLVDPNDTLSAAISVSSALSAALVDPADTLAAVVTPVSTTADVSAALVDPADTIEVLVDVVASSVDVSAALVDPEDTVTAYVAPFVPTVEAPSTPGFLRRIQAQFRNVETEEEKQARRIAQGILKPVPAPVVHTVAQPIEDKYLADLRAGVASAQADLAKWKAQVLAYAKAQEAQNTADALGAELAYAQQEQARITVLLYEAQEQVRLAEQEIEELDISFVAALFAEM
jgi:uncharacterized protein YciU (UPF0263 family)